jgi:hypothetical protein
MRKKLLPTHVVLDYSNAVSRYGPNSPQARAVYHQYQGIAGFAEFAAALAGIKEAVGGCGIDYAPPGSAPASVPVPAFAPGLAPMPAAPAPTPAAARRAVGRD